jgi:hypothetical protein
MSYYQVKEFRNVFNYYWSKVSTYAKRYCFLRGYNKKLKQSMLSELNTKPYAESLAFVKTLAKRCDLRRVTSEA